MEQTILKIKPWHLATALILFLACIHVVGATRENSDYVVPQAEQLEQLTEDEFAEAVSSGMSCVLFYHKDNDTCLEMEQNLVRVREEYKDSIRFYKVDMESVDARRLSPHVKGMPSILIFKNGEEKAGIMGHSSANNIRKIINRC